MEIPAIILMIAWLIIIARCGYKAIQLINSGSKLWLEILFYISVVIIGLSYLL
ncbi:hypothetical protein [Salipaludibacillus keqinensis]|uniref:hypothetical protein n=1 Tax=Salipaludibacillus keqinensis TaxID=2045207 RepID=UPI001E2B630F|nr:hypothetical protein [Salipaludibacillus keqinensis]